MGGQVNKASFASPTVVRAMLVGMAIITLLLDCNVFRAIRKLDIHSGIFKANEYLPTFPVFTDNTDSPSCPDRGCKEPSFPKEPLQNLHGGDNVLLIHVGKAGGTSIRSLHRKAEEQCEDYLDRVSSSDRPPNWKKHADVAQACAFSAVTGPSQLVHMNRRHEDVPKYDHYLVPLRNPVDRLISWYSYETSYLKDPHPKRRSRRLAHLMYCYKDVDSLITDGLSSPSDDASLDTLGTRRPNNRPHPKSQECRQLARDCLTGEYPCYVHNFFNYEWYLERLLFWKGDYVWEDTDDDSEHSSDSASLDDDDDRKDFRIDVLRVEHDRSDLNRTLYLWTHGITSSNDRDSSLLKQYEQKRPNPNGHRRMKTSKFVEPAGLQMLCRSICSELIVYKKILYHADNLYEHEIQQSYQELDERCGLNVDEVCGVHFQYRDVRSYKSGRICNPATDGHQYYFRVGGIHPPC
jgi:hypothetical protein